MGDDWVTVKFGDVLSGGTRNGIYKKKEFHGSGTKIVNMGELFAHPRLRAIPMKRVELTEKELKKSSLEPGDLLFARRSLVAEGAGKCSIVLEVDESTTFESSIIRGRPDPDEADSLFLYYLFNSPHGRYLLGTIRRQVAVAGITGSDLVQLEISLPPLSEQRAIAHILGSLDDKIELNRRMNETLEAMAQAIFKSWFVDFDPVRAKAEGRDTGLPKEIADLFPDSFEDSELGAVPEGWWVGSILEIAELLSGGTPKTKVAEYWGGGIPWVSAKDVTTACGSFIFDTKKTITQSGVEHSNTKLLPKNTTVVTARGTVGSYCILSREMTINQTNYGLKVKSETGDFFIFYSISNMVNQMKIHSYGTVFDTITTKTFKDMKIPIPSESMIKFFDNKVSSIMDRISHNLYESRVLTTIRDTLLPKLISGEMRVPDAEKFVEVSR